jgi:hypothetical protein
LPQGSGRPYWPKPFGSRQDEITAVRVLPLAFAESRLSRKEIAGKRLADLDQSFLGRAAIETPEANAA